MAALADKSGDRHGCVFADEGLAVEDHLDVAAFVEASAKARIYGVTVTDSRALDAGYAERRRQQAQGAGPQAHHRGLQPQPLRHRLRARPRLHRELLGQPQHHHPEVQAASRRRRRGPHRNAGAGPRSQALQRVRRLRQRYRHLPGRRDVLARPTSTRSTASTGFRTPSSPKPGTCSTSPRPRSPRPTRAPTRSSPASRPCSARP